MEGNKLSRDKQRDLQYVRNYKPKTEGQLLRILLHGPAGAGKSSFINSVQSVLLGRMYTLALAANTFSGCFTKKFNPDSKLSKDNQFYNKGPTNNDKVHVLVCVIDANTLSQLSENIVKKIREIRKEASELGIPQVAILTKIDQVCPEIKDDLQNIYKIKCLKEKMEMFSAKVGIPMNCIFPVKNYHEEIDLDRFGRENSNLKNTKLLHFSANHGGK
ncbi:hypothetical protein FQN60_015518 [Etheostoma spectabile]|uniref:G domain-containing protein n=1 Tax=Etheostoma spectabile TaxID=54343 RepID=A0A5J5CM41_9PERO|nr:hypothetical protein FQN60_015518 [Etheostoma spectabile]